MNLGDIIIEQVKNHSKDDNERKIFFFEETGKVFDYFQWIEPPSEKEILDKRIRDFLYISEQLEKHLNL